MSEESGDDLGSVAMPGFIDILSSVITVFMFFMLITSAVMFFMSIQMKKSAADSSRQETQSKIAEEMEQAVKEVQAGEMTVKDLAEKVDQMKQDAKKMPVAQATNPAAPTDPQTPPPEQPQTIDQAPPVETPNQQQARSTFAKSTSQKISEDAINKEMTIIFNDRAISITDDTAKKIADFIAAQRAAMNGKPVSLEIDIPDNPQAATIDISREIGLGRMLNIRNVLLANKLPPTGISVHTITAPAIDNSYDWVRVHVR